MEKRFFFCENMNGTALEIGLPYGGEQKGKEAFWGCPGVNSAVQPFTSMRTDNIPAEFELCIL